MPFGCDDHELTVVSQMRHQSAPQSIAIEAPVKYIYIKVAVLNS